MKTYVTSLLLLTVWNWGGKVGFSEQIPPTREHAATAASTDVSNGGRPDRPRTPAPHELIQKAIAKLEGHRSISTRIRQRVNLFDQELLGSGYYTERRKEGELQFRMELTIQADPDQDPSSLLKVFDGRYLWTYRNLAKGESLGRIDVEHVNQGLEESGRLAELVELGNWPGLGGLPRLLRGLNLAFRFDLSEAQPVRLKHQAPGWKIVGVWRSEQLLNAQPDLKDKIESGKPLEADDLPPHLPTSVVLVLGQTDAFPYGIEFRRGDSLVGGRLEGVTFELNEVKLDAPTKPSWFVYNPGDMIYADQTRDFLKSLGVE